MIQFLVTAVIVVICLFLLILLLCLMVWSISWVLRILFPSKFGTKTPKKKKPTKVKGQRVEDRCAECATYGRCPAAFTGVLYPCQYYSEFPLDSVADKEG